jgi:hypothetical protein
LESSENNSQQLQMAADKRCIISTGTGGNTPARMERQIYLMAWYDATGDNIPASTVLYAEPSALNLPVEEAIHRFAPKSLHCENELLKR